MRAAFILQRQNQICPVTYKYFMAAVAQSPEIGKTKKKSKNVKKKIFVLDTCVLIYDHLSLIHI